MVVKSLKIKGFRGFSEETVLKLAIPNGEEGSGLTVIVGPNNSGKSSIIEAFHTLFNDTQLIPGEAINKKNPNVLIEATSIDGTAYSIQATDNNGSFAERRINGTITQYIDRAIRPFILSSRRNINSTFNNNANMRREDYGGNKDSQDYREQNGYNGNFGARLIKIFKENKDEFNNCLSKVLSPVPDWKIIAKDHNNLSLEFKFNNVSHNSIGAGDGFINIFNIIDSLYDSKDNNLIIIDEPEVSLHPDLQRKLYELLVEYSKKRQIILCTHSPYFIDWNVILNNSELIRVKKQGNESKIYQLTQDTKDKIRNLMLNSFNPHILGISANEIFFLNDNVILTEGQDDVICYKNIFKQKGFSINASFFGFGVGGADNTENIVNLLKNLGYDRVYCIFDNDKRDIASQIQKKYPEYMTFTISANDVRNKEINKNALNVLEKINNSDLSNEVKTKVSRYIKEEFNAKTGFVKDMKIFEINDEYQDNITELIISIQEYFSKSPSFISQKDNANAPIVKENNVWILLDEWISKHKLYDKIQEKYPEFDLNNGGSEIISEKEIAKNKYRFVIEQTAGLSNGLSITILYHFIIDVNKESVKLIKKNITSNTLPVSRLSKFIRSIL